MGSYNYPKTGALVSYTLPITFKPVSHDYGNILDRLYATAYNLDFIRSRVY